jgi:DNA-binding IclR family transcriptional regulator
VTPDRKELGHSQVIERCCRILREVARTGRTGARLVDLTSVTDLSRPTIHRILQSLIAERFVEQRPSRRYSLGAALFELGMAAPSPVSNLEPCRAIIQKLADTVGDTVYLAIRQRDYAFYLLRCEGAFPIKTHVVKVGDTLPLVAGHCGHALLAAMGRDEAETIIGRAIVTPRVFGAGSPNELRREIDSVRRNGFGWAQDVTHQGVAGVAAPVPAETANSYLAVSISAISSRLNGERAMELGPHLLEAVRAIATLENSGIEAASAKRA